MSLYGYGIGNPIFGLDPFGLDWWNPWSWDDEDSEWEEMMRRNQEMVRKILERQQNRGLLTPDEYRRRVRRMQNDLETALLVLELIRNEGKLAVLTTARDAALTVAIALPVGWVLQAGRAWIAAGGPVVYYTWRNGTLFYRIGKSGEWLFASGGRVYRATPTMVPPGSGGLPLPIIYEHAAQEAGKAGARAAGNCVAQGCRVACKGWRGPTP
jgi:hypothetical protein